MEDVLDLVVVLFQRKDSLRGPSVATHEQEPRHEDDVPAQLEASPPSRSG